MLTFKDFREMANKCSVRNLCAGAWRNANPAALIDYPSACEYLSRVGPDLLALCEVFTPHGVTIVRVSHGSVDRVLGYPDGTHPGAYALLVVVGGVEPWVDTNYGLNPSGQTPDAG